MSYLHKSNTSTSTSYTLSMWIKTAKTSGTTSSAIFWNGATNKLVWELNDKGQIYYYNGSVYRTTAYLRDTHGFYHLVWKVSSGTGTLYINGNSALIAGNVSGVGALANGTDIRLGNDGGGDFTGSMAHVHFTDGTAYNPTTFAESDSNGVWVPKLTPSVSYGSGGFFLKFDNSANLGLDSSGQGNNLTVNGTMVQAKDTPTNVHCILNTNDKRFDDTTLTNLGLTVSGGRISTGFDMIRGTIGADSGKWYFEMKAADNAEIDQVGIGILNNISMQNNGANGFYGALQGYGVQMSNGYKVGVGQSGAAYMGGFTTNDICMIAVDLDNDKITFGRNGQWANGSGGADQTYANSTAAFTGLNDIRGYIPMFANRNSGNNNTGIMHFNFGNGQFGTTNVTSAGSNGGGSIFEYDVPSGFYAWNTKNLKDNS